MATVTIAAAGDLLMKSEVIASVKRTGGYKFDPLFDKIAPVLRRHDLTIANLETTFSAKRWHEEARRGRRDCSCPNERRNPKTGYPTLSCPDALAPALRKAGFNVMITANNHCMDGGTSGLMRTLNVLDRYGIQHAGTSRSPKESARQLIIRVKGIRIGILAYTSGTNSIAVPKPWLVSRIDRRKMIADLRQLRTKADFILVYLHFGREYRSAPSKSQRQLMQLLFRHGANAVLGAHPHVLHPVTLTKAKDIRGHIRNRAAASSLGNFLSSRLHHNARTTRGMILSLTITKNDQGVTDIAKIGRIPTIVRQSKQGDRSVYQIVLKR